MPWLIIENAAGAWACQQLGIPSAREEQTFEQRCFCWYFKAQVVLDEQPDQPRSIENFVYVYLKDTATSSLEDEFSGRSKVIRGTGGSKVVASFGLPEVRSFQNVTGYCVRSGWGVEKIVSMVKGQSMDPLLKAALMDEVYLY
ncbi:hypothetical protein Slin14017_G118300 [Septoria linicola]|nr:hypothetical protein Slin14017_G118300 [Septoria linicola]